MVISMIILQEGSGALPVTFALSAAAGLGVLAFSEVGLWSFCVLFLFHVFIYNSSHFIFTKRDFVVRDARLTVSLYFPDGNNTPSIRLSCSNSVCE